MYSVEITVEKDKVTGETRVLSSTTSLPREPLLQGVKVYEDETKGTRPPRPAPNPLSLPEPEPDPHLT